ncbi:MAG: phosphoribosylanthranilate isomerase [Caldilineaceae bacterium]|nr:phosphoribosylanthranilate isomerase [Caldilineaceae bacterium]
MTVVKICGLRDPDTAVEAAKAGADMIGLMFAESRRRVTPQECFDVCEAIRGIERRTHPPVQFEAPARDEVRGLGWFGAWAEAIDTSLIRWRPLLVGVFADQPFAEVNEISEAAGLDFVQLSGGEDAEFIASVRFPVLSAVHVAASTDCDDILDRARERRSAAAILLDTAAGTARGGTGEAFDWDVAAGAAERLPFLLGGGLTPENVADAVARVQPWGVDVSSGVETGGAKDITKVRAFIRAAKEATHAR